MKTIITLICLFFILSTHAQSRIGFTEYQIRNEEFPEKTFNTSYSETTKRKFITWQDDDVTCFYYFNSLSICDECYIKVKNQGYLNAYVQSFNSKYVIISDTEWKMYTNTGIVDIKLLHLGDDTFFNFVPLK